MKRIVLMLASIAIFVAVSYAQDYLVYTVKGDVIYKSGASVVKVEPGMKLNAKVQITIPADSRLIVLNEASKKLYTIKVETVDLLENLVKKQGNSTQQLTESYLAFIKQKITDSGNPKDKNHMQSAGTSYRDADSLLLKTLVPDEQVDTTKKTEVKKEEKK